MTVLALGFVLASQAKHLSQTPVAIFKATSQYIATITTNKGSGSAFMIGPNTAVTCYHVVEGSPHAVLTFPKSTASARSVISHLGVRRVLAIDVQNDIAELEVDRWLDLDEANLIGMSPEQLGVYWSHQADDPDIASAKAALSAAKTAKAHGSRNDSKSSDSRQQAGTQGLSFGDYSALQPGETVYVIGSPLGLDQTITAGIVSNKRSGPGGSLLQLSASVSPGSSGSPVLNSKGQVVGMVSGSIEAGQQLNFAVPCTYLRALKSGVPLGLMTRAGDRKPNGVSSVRFQDIDGAWTRDVAKGWGSRVQAWLDQTDRVMANVDPSTLQGDGYAKGKQAESLRGLFEANKGYRTGFRDVISDFMAEPYGLAAGIEIWNRVREVTSFLGEVGGWSDLPGIRGAPDDAISTSLIQQATVGYRLQSEYEAQRRALLRWYEQRAGVPSR